MYLTTVPCRKQTKVAQSPPQPVFVIINIIWYLRVVENNTDNGKVLLQKISVKSNVDPAWIQHGMCFRVVSTLVSTSYQPIIDFRHPRPGILLVPESRYPRNWRVSRGLRPRFSISTSDLTWPPSLQMARMWRVLRYVKPLVNSIEYRNKCFWEYIFK